MSAPRENKFWSLRKRHGRPRKFSDEKLWEAACDYFQWVDEHPWIKKDFVSRGPKARVQVEIRLQRPYTIVGFCLSVGISLKTFLRYEATDVNCAASRIRAIIYTQQFEGAAVGVFNAGLIARSLGLRAKKQLKFENTAVITGMVVK